MAKQLQLRRGTTTEHSTFTGAIGEITVDTTKDTIVVHDGTTAGGKPLAVESHLHTGVYEPADATILKTANIGTTVQEQLVSGTNIKTLNGSSVLGSGDLVLSGGATGGGTDRIFVENDQVVTTDYTLVGTKNASTAGPITINTGVTVTVETGARWVIV